MTKDQEQEIHRAVVATANATLSLVNVPPSPLTELHRRLLRDAASCFTKAAELLRARADFGEDVR